MADVKISALPSASLPLAGTEIVPLVQSGTTVQTPISNLGANLSSAAINANTSSAALRVTQTGSGNAILVEDSANPDSTPFVVNNAGQVIIGSTTASLGSTLFGIYNSADSTTPAYSDFLKNRAGAIVQSGDGIGRIRFFGFDGASYRVASEIYGTVAGTPGSSDMPGALTFATTPDGSAATTIRMVVGQAGNVNVGPTGTPSTSITLQVNKNITGSTSATGVHSNGSVQSDVSGTASYVLSTHNVAAGSAVSTLRGHSAVQGTITGTVTLQKGFYADTTLIAATTNHGFFAGDTAGVTAGKTAYGFYSNVNIATGGGTTWGFYGAGTAPNYFAGDMRLDKTVTAAGTTGAQTINKNAGTVNFAALATSVVVTDSRVTTSSIIIATVATVDTTMKSVVAVAGAGSFTLTANAAATAETRVNWLVIN
jgi:hypothetical protein